jgi:hypothetical protein
MQPTHVPRHPSGAIDYDFYRRRAAKLRRRQVRGFVRGMATMTRPLIAAALLGVMLVAMPTRAPETAGRATDVAATGLDVTSKAN